MCAHVTCTCTGGANYTTELDVGRYFAIHFVVLLFTVVRVLPCRERHMHWAALLILGSNG